MDRVLIVSGSEQAVDTLAKLLSSSGYTKISTVSSGNEARRLITQNDYSMIVINSPLSDEFGHELSVDIAERSTAGVIFICKADIADDVSDKIGVYGVCVVPKPLNKSFFYQSVKLVSATHARLMGMQSENNKLLTKLSEIKLINRAKCVLIQYLKMTEPQAHRYIEKQAMDNSQTKREVAEQILMTYDI